MRILKKMIDELSYHYKRLCYDKDFYESYKFSDDIIIDDIPGFTRLPYKVAIIADELFYNSLKGVVELVYITPSNYLEALTLDIDVLLIVSSWRGLNNEWRGMVYDKTAVIPVIEKICQRFKEVNPSGKTVFYSKEDPVNYEHFVEYSCLTDWVFTTAIEKINSYKEYCNHDRVDVLPFGFNPYLFNPYYSKENTVSEGVLFAGSWMRKYPKRCASLSMIFDGLIDAGANLKIIDRNYAIKHAKYMYPFKYTKYCLPSLKHHQLIKLYHDFDTIININSITESKTMFAVRAFELLAMGKIVISNESIGMEEMLPEIIVINEPEDIKKFIQMNEEEKNTIRQEGITNVFQNHTMFHRVEELMAKVSNKVVSYE